jgi:hypothetical protein
VQYKNILKLFVNNHTQGVFMKKSFLVTAIFATACSINLPEEKPKPEETSPSTQVAPHIANPTKDICSYNKDPDKGCLKATISGSELTIGDFSYSIGVKAFARQFNTDLQSSGQIELNKEDTLEFSQRVTVQNFYSNFIITIEGTHTTYAATQTGLGNLVINGMSPGLYSVLLSKDFELKILNKGQVVGYRCVTVWSRLRAEIASGQETPFPEAISQFEMEIFNNSCSGLRDKTKIGGASTSTQSVSSDSNSTLDTSSDPSLEESTTTDETSSTERPTSSSDGKTDTKSKTTTPSSSDNKLPSSSSSNSTPTKV